MRSLVLASLRMVPACGDDSEESGADAAGACDICPAGQGCMRPTVTRTADDSLQPWVVWQSSTIMTKEEDRE